MDNDSLAGIAEALAARANVGGEHAPEPLTPGELVAVHHTFGALKRHVEAAFTPVAAEIARQSHAELGKDSLAKKASAHPPCSSRRPPVERGEAIRIVQVARVQPSTEARPRRTRRWERPL